MFRSIVGHLLPLDGRRVVGGGRSGLDCSSTSSSSSSSSSSSTSRGSSTLAAAASAASTPGFLAVTCPGEDPGMTDAWHGLVRVALDGFLELVVPADLDQDGVEVLADLRDLPVLTGEEVGVLEAEREEGGHAVRERLDVLVGLVRDPKFLGPSAAFKVEEQISNFLNEVLL